MVTEELFALVDFQSFQSQPQGVVFVHAKKNVNSIRGKDSTFHRMPSSCLFPSR